MTKNNALKKALMLNSIILSIMSVAPAQYAKLPSKNEPYPANPVGMQTYINKTKPNVAIVFDNSITMRTKMKKKIWAELVQMSYQDVLMW